MAAGRKQSRTGKRSRWSARVTRESDALDLESEVFKKKSAKAIARSLKRSAERSSRRKSPPFRSAMSMLTFYMNRAGKNLPASRLKVLANAKDELRKLYGREPTAGGKSAPKKRVTRAKTTRVRKAVKK
jgi:Protein of unknown function (DUF3175)